MRLFDFVKDVLAILGGVFLVIQSFFTATPVSLDRESSFQASSTVSAEAQPSAVLPFPSSSSTSPAASSVPVFVESSIPPKEFLVTSSSPGCVACAATIAPPVSFSASSTYSASSSIRAASSTSMTISLPLLPPSAISSPDPVLRSIDPQSIVGISCYFKNRVTNQSVMIDKGSGVIIDPRGYLITSRHLIDLDFAAGIDPRFEEYADLYIFDYCDVGQIAKDVSLPTPEQIRSLNPVIQLPVLGFRAHLIYLPNDAEVSDLESKELDFAVLKIDGVTEDGRTFGITMPPSFPAAALLEDVLLLTAGDEVVTYGYPGDVSLGLNSSFNTLYLVGSAGTVTDVLGGDDHFFNKPFVINTKMSVSGGRSGSPLLWRGYVAGLVAAYREGNSADSFSVAASAIREFLPSELQSL